MSNLNNDENLLVNENFADLLAETFSESTSVEGSVVRGTIIAIESDNGIIDVGLKSEGRIPLKEFTAPGQDPELQVGDTVEVYVERMEDFGARPSVEVWAFDMTGRRWKGVL